MNIVFGNIKVSPYICWIFIFIFLFTISYSSSCCFILIFSSIFPLLLSLIVSIIINNLFSIVEIFNNFILGSDLSLHPWVSKDFINCHAFIGVHLHHLLKHVFEFSRVDIFIVVCFSMGLPKHLSLITS